jgi:hypothetical protein
MQMRWGLRMAGIVLSGVLVRAGLVMLFIDRRVQSARGTTQF